MSEEKGSMLPGLIVFMLVATVLANCVESCRESDFNEQQKSSPRASSWNSSPYLYITKALAELKIKNAAEYEWKEEYNHYKVRYRRYSSDPWSHIDIPK